MHWPTVAPRPLFDLLPSPFTAMCCAATATTPDLDEEARRAAHWQANCRLTAGLLILWFVITFVSVYFARELDFKVLGWPFSFWVAAQGSLLVYLLIVVVYARALLKWDRQWGIAEIE